MGVLYEGSVVNRVLDAIKDQMDAFEQEFVERTNTTFTAPMSGAWKSVNSYKYFVQKFKPQMDELNTWTIRMVDSVREQLANEAERAIRIAGGTYKPTIRLVNKKSFLVDMFEQFKDKIDSLDMKPDEMDSYIEVLKKIEVTVKDRIAAIKNVITGVTSGIGEEQKAGLLSALTSVQNQFTSKLSAQIAEIIKEIKAASSGIRGTGSNGGYGYTSTGSNGGYSYTSTGSNGGYSYTSTGSNGGYSYTSTGSNGGYSYTSTGSNGGYSYSSTSSN